MNERKNINNFFQDKFENFEVNPDPMVWENIEAKLKEKKKRRVIPFWWNYAGIAAALLIGIFIYNFEFKDTSKFVNKDNSVVNKENESNKKENVISKSNSIDAVKTNEVVVDNNKSTVSTTSTIINNRLEKIANSKNNTQSNRNVSANSEIVNSKNSPFQKQNSETRKSSIITNNSQVKLAETSEKTLKGNKIKSESNSNNAIAISENKVKTNTNQKNSSVNKNRSIATNRSQEKLASVSKKSSKSSKTNSKFASNNDAVTIENVDKNKKESVENKSIVNEVKNNAITNTTFEDKKLVLNPIVKTDIQTIKKIDSTKIAIVEPNALEELNNEKEKKTITEPKLNRWQVSSNVAPIYFSSLSSGSPLDDRLKNNEKKYSANNQSYGIGASYALSKKLRVRTGVNLLNVDYNTNGITYYQTESFNSKLSNLNVNSAGSSIIIENLSNVDTPFNKTIQKAEGSLNQKLGYIEMPLEITYKVLDKKFGIDFIGGMSTMVLNKNEIYLQSSTLNLKIGEANNLNSVHFSGNLGLGFKYALLKHFEARLEPVFKYQINTFSNDSGDFKPYVFGVYSGINFTF